ncbi:MAG TPA: hypoxanthine phosphoribosyltransferase [Phycisphaerales bacterium]|nr:hypoxanthine phosphoribosyltransferase [Phycisphaerales bacterium]
MSAPGRVLIDRRRIAGRVDAMASEIEREYSGCRDAVLFVPVLDGALLFAADLIRRLSLPLQLAGLAASSYPGAATTSTGQVELGLFRVDVQGRRVLLLDDILDTGQTLATVQEALRQRGAIEVRSAVLLRKQRENPPVVEADFVGFEVPDCFVIGYGLDHDGRYRELPDVRVLDQDNLL